MNRSRNNPFCHLIKACDLVEKIMGDVQDGIYDVGTVCNLFVNMDNSVVVDINEIVETSVWSQEDIHMVIMYDDLMSDIMTSCFMLEEQNASANGEISWKLRLVTCTEPGADGSWNVFAFMATKNSVTW